jgi:valyl-tRNA synthetase
MVDTEKEKARLNQELAKVQVEIDRLVKKLSNAEFVSKAPEKVVQGEKAKLEKYENTKKGILEALNAL